MARGKNSRGRRDPRSMSRFADPELLAQLLARMGGKKGKAKPQVDSDMDPEELHNEWEDALSVFLGEHDDDVAVRAEKLRAKLTVKSIDRCSGVKCSVAVGVVNYECSMDIDIARRSFGYDCTCGDLELCEHTYFMGLKLEAMLEDPQSALSKAILGEAANNPDKEFRQTLSLLKSLTQNAQLEQAAHTEVTVEEKPQTRYVWNLAEDGYYGSSRLFPCIQQEKKGGWTKGKESTIEAFSKRPIELVTYRPPIGRSRQTGTLAVSHD